MHFDTERKFYYGWDADEVLIYAKDRNTAEHAMAKLLDHGTNSKECSHLHTVWKYGAGRRGQDLLLVLIPDTSK